jgi:transmembrane sensor
MDEPTPRRERRAWRTDDEWDKLRERIAIAEAVRPRPKPWHRAREWLIAGAIAATLFIAATATLVVRKRIAHNAPIRRVVHTKPGERLVVHLDDSSTITVGPATTVRTALSDSRREVDLDGVADFRVVHNAARPFVVRAAGAEATDIGTEFVVRAYASDSAAQVAVASGSVSLANRSGPRGEMTLYAGEVGMVRGTDKPFAIHNVNAATYGSWISGTLTFDDVTLPEVARELSRWFDVNVHIGDAALASRHVTAVYTNPTISSVLAALSATLGVRSTRAGRDIVLRTGGR